MFQTRLAWQSWRSAAAIRRELEEVPGEPAESRFPRSHLAFPFLMLFARTVRKRRGVVFHSEGGLRLRLDVYRPAVWSPDDPPRPAVIQVHGGGWIAGSRLEQGIPLLNHMAANGWVGFNVDYRLSPRATLPDHVIDVKRAIAWVREHADELRVDPQRICLTGGSAGGHLCALAALTADDRSLQPGFEDADTSVAAAVPFYGVYDMLDEDAVYYEGLRSWLLEEIVIKRRRDEDPEAFRAVSPTHRVHPGAPPFLVFHGERDTLVPPEDARAFVERLEATPRARCSTSSSPAPSTPSTCSRRCAPRGWSRASSGSCAPWSSRRPRTATANRDSSQREGIALRHEPGDPPRGPRGTAAPRRRRPIRSTASKRGRVTRRRDRDPRDLGEGRGHGHRPPPRLDGQRRHLARGAGPARRAADARDRLRPAGLRRGAAARTGGSVLDQLVDFAGTSGPARRRAVAAGR